MQEKHLFEYSVIRIVPCVEKEEFINAGIILYCASQKFLEVIYKVDETRMSAFPKQPDIIEINNRLCAFQQIAKGAKEAGAIAALPLASRFRWLAATKSTIIQTSPVHPGLCVDAKETIVKLFKQLTE